MLLKWKKVDKVPPDKVDGGLDEGSVYTKKAKEKRRKSTGKIKPKEESDSEKKDMDTKHAKGSIRKKMSRPKLTRNTITVINMEVRVLHSALDIT